MNLNPFRAIGKAIDNSVESKLTAFLGWLFIKLVRVLLRAGLQLLIDVDSPRADTEYAPALALIVHDPDSNQPKALGS